MNIITPEYLLLFNAITDAEKILRGLQDYLQTVQQQAEELFLAAGDGAQAEEPPPAQLRKDPA